MGSAFRGHLLDLLELLRDAAGRIARAVGRAQPVAGDPDEAVSRSVGAAVGAAGTERDAAGAVRVDEGRALPRAVADADIVAADGAPGPALVELAADRARLGAGWRTRSPGRGRDCASRRVRRRASPAGPSRPGRRCPRPDGRSPRAQCPADWRRSPAARTRAAAEGVERAAGTEPHRPERVALLVFRQAVPIGTAEVRAARHGVVQAGLALRALPHPEAPHAPVRLGDVPAFPRGVELAFAVRDPRLRGGVERDRLQALRLAGLRIDVAWRPWVPWSNPPRSRPSRLTRWIMPVSRSETRNCLLQRSKAMLPSAAPEFGRPFSWMVENSCGW